MITPSIQIAIQTLRKNKGRTALTILGIVIGIMAVIAVLSTGQAIKQFIVGQVEAFGTNIIQVEVKTPQTSQQSTENAFSLVGGAVVTTLKESDGEALAKLANIDKFYTGLMGQKLATYESKIKKAMLFGTNAAFIEVDTSKIDKGRFFTEEENKGLAKVVILGDKIRNNLLGDQNPINQYIKIDNDRFLVIGTLAKRGATMGLDMDNMIFMPVETLQKRVLGIDYVSFILLTAKDKAQAEITAGDIIEKMRERHKITDPDKDDFAVTTSAQMMKMLDTIMYGIQALLIALGSISLIVGGVGIMNIMYVSVTERTFEIGLRKAVGAQYHDILWQFLTEAIIITFFGAIIGIILGLSLTFLVSVIATASGFEWAFSISWSGLVIAVIMSVVVGLIFGIYPAQQAAKKHPIEALRFE